MSSEPRWNPALYQASHAFVWERGRELIPLLAPRAGERILDIGCGTGQLTAEIARTGARVVEVDRSAEMLREARCNFPDLEFAAADVRALPFAAAFDGLFSNAVLHWVGEAESAARSMARALKPGGRLVVEFGGRGNIAALMEALYGALKEMGVPDPERLNPWYYPSAAEYATLLERAGLEVSYAALFDRPTPLEPGAGALARWLAMFGKDFLAPLEPERHGAFFRAVERRAARRLLRDGICTVDYRRIRAAAVKPI